MTESGDPAACVSIVNGLFAALGRKWIHRAEARLRASSLLSAEEGLPGSQDCFCVNRLRVVLVVNS